MSICESDPGLPVWAHRCGHILADGRPCGRLVADSYVYCFGHSVALGYVAGHTCAGVGASGRPCRRLVRREGGYCWQHEPEGA